MKQVICCFLFLCLFNHASAQKNIYFKKEKPKYTLLSKTPGLEQNKQQQLLSPISFYTTSLQLKRSYVLNIPKPYIVIDSKDVILYIIGLGSSILGSIYADKLHYNYTGDFMDPPINYRQNAH